MAQGDLTTLANIKAWLLPNPPASNNSDGLLGRLITAASLLALGYMNRNIASALYTERRNGNNRESITLNNGPVTSVTTIQFDGQTITTPATGNPPSGGYLIENVGTLGGLVLTDTYFPRGRLNVLVTYRAGFLVVETPLAALTFTAGQTWVTDAGVTLANGTALTPVAANPAAMQYSVNSGVYNFNAAQVGTAIIVSYGTVPADVEQAVIEIAGERYKAMDRIGLTSKTLNGQEVIVFTRADLSLPIKLALDNYRRVAPFWS